MGNFSFHKNRTFSLPTEAAVPGFEMSLRMHGAWAVAQLALDDAHELGAQAAPLQLRVHCDAPHLCGGLVVGDTSVGSEFAIFIPTTDMVIISIFAVDFLDGSDLLADHEHQITQAHDLVELIQTQVVKTMGGEFQDGHDPARIALDSRRSR